MIIFKRPLKFYLVVFISLCEFLRTNKFLQKIKLRMNIVYSVYSALLWLGGIIANRIDSRETEVAWAPFCIFSRQ